MNLVEIKQELANLDRLAVEFYTLVDEGAIAYNDGYIAELDESREALVAAIAAEEAANEEALYWESLELSI